MPFAFLLGLFLIMAGCSLRVWCYRVLGRLFTYEVAFRPAHTLVTRAPYKLVRHPSYTGLYMHFIGVAILHFAPGSWNRECGIMYTRAAIWVWVWLVLGVFMFVSVARRSAVEDRVMKEKFADAWEKYRRDVPFMFFPGIF
ncbi:hypothetical protein OF83DRAFT_1148657 [Amylostereum chailletii]|nr:hypothetical protein OF83DRAFT_1148657 [Amylostereum chailletii]